MKDIQKELKLEEKQQQQQQQQQQQHRLRTRSQPAPQDSDRMKAVMDRLESRKLVDILSKGWGDAENKELVSRLLSTRLAYAEQHEMSFDRVEALDDDHDHDDEDDDDDGDSGPTSSHKKDIMEKDSEFETLYEYMVDDMSVLYEAEVTRASADDGSDDQHENFSERIMALMEEKYQLRAVEKALREENKHGGWVLWCHCLCLLKVTRYISHVLCCVVLYPRLAKRTSLRNFGFFAISFLHHSKL
jgi:hypothetical protein